MKYLTGGASGYIFVTVTEKQTLTSPYWLLRLIKDDSQKEYTQIVTDSSTSTTRYNKFSVNATSLPSGIYTYYIYEQSSAVNTDYTLATTLCEVGQIQISGTSVFAYSEPTYSIERS